MRLEVYLNARGERRFVGLLEERGGDILFEYDKRFLDSGIELSPFLLPLRPGVASDPKRTFDGLFGVFNDSLPDGWGLLLLDRLLRRSGLPLERITPLSRLSLVGRGGMGAPPCWCRALPRWRSAGKAWRTPGRARPSMCSRPLLGLRACGACWAMVPAW